MVVAIRPRDFADIVARPEKIVTLGNHNPRSGVIEPKMALDRQWYLYRPIGVIRRTVRNGQHCDLHERTALLFSGKHDDGRTILATFLMTRQMLVVPPVCVGNDKTRFRPGDRHRPG